MKPRTLSPILLACTMLFTYYAYAQELQDVVYLKNGSIIRGIIVEQIPNKTLKIKTADGSVFVYQMDDVTRITREAMPTQLRSSTASVSSPTGWSLPQIPSARSSVEYHGYRTKGI
jgi:hypothetical protein